MSRKMVMAIIALFMLFMAIAVANFAREPVTLRTEARMDVGQAVRGTLDASPVDPTAAATSTFLDMDNGIIKAEQMLKDALPPVESLLMGSGEKPLPSATPSQPLTAPEQEIPAPPANSAQEVRAGSTAVTEPPKALAEAVPSEAPRVPGAPSTPTQPTQSSQPAVVPSAPAATPATPAVSGSQNTPVTPSNSTQSEAIGEQAAVATPPPVAEKAPEQVQDTPAVPVNQPESASAQAPAQTDSTPASAETSAPADAVKPLKPGTIVRTATMEAKSTPTFTSVELMMDGDVVTLTIKSNVPMQKGKTMLLKDPDRVVLDIPGNWHSNTPGVPSNRMVRSLRLGQQTDSTRFVFDMRVKPQKATVKLVDENTMELKVR